MSKHRWTVHSGSDLGRAVADIRHLRNRTQAELATDAGIGRTWLAKFEAGRTSPVLEHLLRLLRRLGASVTITIDDTEKPDAS